MLGAAVQTEQSAKKDFKEPRVLNSHQSAKRLRFDRWCGLYVCTQLIDIAPLLDVAFHSLNFHRTKRRAKMWFRCAFFGASPTPTDQESLHY